MVNIYIFFGLFLIAGGGGGWVGIEPEIIVIDKASLAYWVWLPSDVKDNICLVIDECF